MIKAEILLCLSRALGTENSGQKSAVLGQLIYHASLSRLHKLHELFVSLVLGAELSLKLFFGMSFVAQLINPPFEIFLEDAGG
jgi:hypothetical protein